MGAIILSNGEVLALTLKMHWNNSNFFALSARSGQFNFTPILIFLDQKNASINPTIPNGQLIIVFLASPEILAYSPNENLGYTPKCWLCE